MIPASLPMPNQDCLRYRHCTWALWAPSRNLIDILLLGRTRGTKGSYSKGHAHVSSPQVLGGVEDSSKDLKSLYSSNLLIMCWKPVSKSINLKRSQVNRRDGRSMSLVQPTDRDLLTALGQNNIDLHQTRVPGLEFGTG